MSLTATESKTSINPPAQEGDTPAEIGPEGHKGHEASQGEDTAGATFTSLEEALLSFASA